jgi:GWxTD domain-containing protein
MGLVASCSTYKNLDREDLSKQYDIDNTLSTRYVIQHVDTLNTAVFYQFNFSDFKYFPSRTDTVRYYARYKLEYQLFKDIKALELLDSSSIVFVDSMNFEKNNSTIGYFELEIPYNSIYFLRIVLSDLNAEKEVTELIKIDKGDHKNRQNFILYAQDNLPVMNPSVERNQKYKLVYNDTAVKELHVRYFKSFMIPPEPPMMNNPNRKTIKIKTDSSYQLTLSKGQSDYLTFNKQGLYHFSLDSNESIGYTVAVFTESYPWISTPMQMAAPLRYITTNKEYKSVMTAEDKKKAVDNFWLDLSSNSQRAEAMISIYYNRVQEANRLFASDREGWLTDRGMIFITYGPPDRVYRNENLETWTYGNVNRTGVSFTFLKINSPLTENDYQLDRSPSYINSWNSTIEFWRR